MNETMEAEVISEITVTDNSVIPDIKEFDILDIVNEQVPQEVEEVEEVEDQKIIFNSEIEAEEIDIKDEIDVNYLINASEVVGQSSIEASIEEQNTLFDALISYYTLSNSILDVGCRRADLFAFLQNKYPNDNINYTGIDYNADLINIAKEKYPDVELDEIDFLYLISDVNFDWVVGSGLFNDNPQENKADFTKYFIDKMYEKCKIGVAFNLNIGKVDDNDTMLVSWNAAEWLGYLISKYGKVICRADYLDTDVTFFIFK